MKIENPLSTDILTNLFRTTRSDSMRIINREGMTIEFKESFNFGSMAQYLKTMASFANHKGGYIIFGVGDKPRRLLGLKEKHLEQFEDFKVEVFTQTIMDYFSPAILWDHCTFEYKGLSFGVIYTYEAKRKPCICKKSYDASNKKYSLKEGDIYFRYSGKSERIKYNELEDILSKERLLEEERWLHFLKNAAKVGIDNVGLLDINEGVLSGTRGSILIQEDLLNKISFIKEGEFVEKKGKPTLRLIGDIERVDTGKLIVKETTRKVGKAIEMGDLVTAFLENREVDEPMEYVRAVCSANSANYPIYYFIKKSGGTISDAINIIEKSKARGQTRKRLIERLEGKYIKQQFTTETNTRASQERKNYIDYWKKETLPDNIQDVKRCLEAFLSLDGSILVSKKTYIKKILGEIFASYYTTSKPNIAALIRSAICRMDEVINCESI